MLVYICKECGSKPAVKSFEDIVHMAKLCQVCYNKQNKESVPNRIIRIKRTRKDATTSATNRSRPHHSRV